MFDRQRQPSVLIILIATVCVAGNTTADTPDFTFLGLAGEPLRGLD